MRQIFLVARREYLAYVGAWGFWVSLITTPLIILVFGAAPTLLRNAEPARVLTIVAERQVDEAAVRAAFDDRERDRARAALSLAAQALPEDVSERALAAFDAAQDREAAVAAGRAVLAAASPALAQGFSAPAPAYVFVAPPARDPQALTPYLRGQRTVSGPSGSQPLFAVLVVRREGGAPALDYWSDNVTDREPQRIAEEGLAAQMREEALTSRGVSPGEARALKQLQPESAQFRPGAAEAVTVRDRAPFLVAMALAFVLWMSVFSISNMLLTGVIEEKSNKILDTLMTSVAPAQILAGKLFGVAAVSLTLFGVWGAIGGFALFEAAQGAGGLLLGATEALRDPMLIATFVASFVLGYLLYGVLFLAIGSLCESLQEAQTLISPLFLVLAAPMLLLLPSLENPDAPMVVTASWIPLFTPFVLMMRAASGLTPLEAIGPLTLTAVTVILALILAGRVFRAGATSQLSMADIRRILPFLAGKGAKPA